MSTPPFRVLAAAVLLLTPLTAGIISAQAANGDLWETKSEVSMEGMPMKKPARTSKSCAPTEWKQPPGGQKNCKSSNMKVDGHKVAWDVQCTDPTMTGAGEILREGTDAYSGTIKFTSAQGHMTVTLTGKKIGTCDKPE